MLAEMEGVEMIKSKRVIAIVLLVVLGLPWFRTLGQAEAARHGQRVVETSLTSRPVDLSLEELVPGVHWSTWYQQASGYEPDPDHFGAYVTLAVGKDLYIGLGSARPAENSGDGALLAGFDGTSLAAIGALTEQGFHEMLWHTDTLHIAGTDPCCGDDWSAGNHYTYSPPGPVVKHRDPVNGLVDVLHTWGLWMSEEHVLYAAVSSDHDGAGVGEVFESRDKGLTWTELSDLGEYRAYDIVGFRGRLYALYTDVSGGPPRLATSDDDGGTWTDVMADDVHRVHLVAYRDRLLVLSFDRKSIYAVAEDTVDRYDLPAGITVGVTYPDGMNYNYNLLAVVGGHLYTIWEEQIGGDTQSSIVRTADLQNWERLASTGGQLISLSYWPARRWLIASDNGVDGKLWKIALPATVWLPFVTRQ